jgi:hypothetical protein
MILSTHAVLGGAIAGLFPSHPVLVAVAAFASHFAIDAIPHWDYHLRTISLKPGANNRRLIGDRRFFQDLALIGLDAGAGLLIAIWLFATPATIGVIVLGALAGPYFQIAPWRACSAFTNGSTRSGSLHGRSASARKRFLQRPYPG